jgi:hypothetical protein
MQVIMLITIPSDTDDARRWEVFLVFGELLKNVDILTVCALARCATRGADNSDK